jgi:nucleoside-diphosphate-sugar epimerase
MKILVLGGSGLVGSNLLSKLATKHDVLAPTSKTLDLVNDLTDYMTRHRFEQLIYCAQYRKRNAVDSSVESIRKVNGMVLEQILSNRKICPKSIIYLSSGGIYAPNEGLLHENSAIRPDKEMDEYFTAKRDVEQLLLQQKNLIRTNIIRLFTVYGKNAHPSSLFPRIEHQILSGAALKVPQTGEDLLRPVHASDVSNAISALLNYDSSSLHNFGGPEIISFRTIAEKIGVRVNRIPKFIYENRMSHVLAPDNVYAEKSLVTPKIKFDGEWNF